MSNLFDAARAMGVSFQREVEPRSGHVDTGEVRLHYLEWGEPGKPNMLLLHGFAQTAHSWDFVGLALCHAYHIIALDARGHGDSQWAPNGDYSPQAHQRDLDAVLDRLALPPVTVVGLSMGGRSAYTLAARRPGDVKRLVIVDTGPVTQRQGSGRIRNFVQLPDMLDSFEEFLERVHQYQPHRPMEQLRGSLVHNIRQLPNGKWTWKYDKVLRDPSRPRPAASPEEAWNYIKSIQCPTLLVRGANSDVLARETAEEMVRVMSDCQLVEIDRAGHLVPGDNPARFIQELGRWLESRP